MADEPGGMLRERGSESAGESEFDVSSSSGPSIDSELHRGERFGQKLSRVLKKALRYFNDDVSRGESRSDEVHGQILDLARN